MEIYRFVFKSADLCNAETFFKSLWLCYKSQIEAVYHCLPKLNNLQTTAWS